MMAKQLHHNNIRSSKYPVIKLCLHLSICPYIILGSITWKIYLENSGIYVFVCGLLY
jgi:hypothetical protein